MARNNFLAKLIKNKITIANISYETEDGIYYVDFTKKSDEQTDNNYFFTYDELIDWLTKNNYIQYFAVITKLTKKEKRNKHKNSKHTI